MTTRRSSRTTITTLAFGWLGLLLIACGCHRHSDAALQQRLVGTWRYLWSEGNISSISGNLTFTVATNGSYVSQFADPATHLVEGMAEIKNGYLTITVTNCDNTSVFPPQTDHQAIIELNDSELVTVSEGSSLTNHFRKQ